MNLFDHYALRARLQPAFLAFLPLAVGAFAWAQPGEKALAAVWSLLGTTGFTFLLANIARNRGKQLEPQLWKSWGGAPTTQLLRHSGPANPELRSRWHKHLAKLFGQPLPTVEAENDNLGNADASYEAVTRLLIGATYDKTRFPFVYRENVNYGFCRNLYGLKAIGMTSAAIGLITGGAAAGWMWYRAESFILPLGCAAIDLIFFVWWLLGAKSEWVKVPAMNYAQHLLQSTEQLAKKTRSTVPKPRVEE